jgi:uncharacterized membrane protein YfcA
MTDLDAIGLTAAAVAAGLVNSLAGGGTLITFPALLVTGMPSVVANVTNSVAMAAGYLGGILSQRKDLHGQWLRMHWLLPAAAAGGVLGALLVLNTSEKLFSSLVPWLILLGSLLLAVQGPLRQWLVRRTGSRDSRAEAQWAVIPVLLAAGYGGYFGAGLGVIVLAILALTINDSLTRLNGIKQAISFAANSMAAVVFLISGQVSWGAAGLMAMGSMVGGALGGRLAGKVNPKALQVVVVTLGTAFGLFYLWH